MEILFGILVLALLFIGLLNRKKSQRKWLKEERYEESGNWIDKRSGERGTFGSLDEEMESNRSYIARQSRISELALDIQGILFTYDLDFQGFNEAQIKQHLATSKSLIAGLFDQIESWSTGKPVSFSDSGISSDELQTMLKKKVLDFAFDRFPKLLDLDIEQIQKVDLAAAQLAHRLRSEVSRLKG